MAGDWIQMRTNLWTDPRVVRISSACNADRARTLGGLFRLWSLGDEHSTDGILAGYTPDFIDSECGINGFADALQVEGWLAVSPQGVSIPHFTEHNGQSAKRRIQDASRKKSVRKTSACNADKKRTTEDNRREEKNPLPKSKGKPPKSPKGELPSFVEFWQAVARHKRKNRKDAVRRYTEVVASLKGRLKDPAAWLLERTAAYYSSDVGNTQYALGPAPWLYQGGYDDDPESWKRETFDGKPSQPTPSRVQAAPGKYDHFDQPDDAGGTGQ